MFERLRGRRAAPDGETEGGAPARRDDRVGPGDGYPDEKLGPGDGRHETGPETWRDERPGTAAVRDRDASTDRAPHPDHDAYPDRDAHPDRDAYPDRDPHPDRDPYPDRDRDDIDDRTEVGGSGATAGTAAEDVLASRRTRERSEFGGMDWPASLFGWLVAIGLGVLLIALLGAAGTAIGLTEANDTGDVTANADTISIVGGILLVCVLLVAYFAGGYVAGRMARFDGARQGFGVWAIALLVTIVLAVAGVVLGAEYNVLDQLNFPRIPVDEGSLTTGGLITLAAIVLGTLLAAVAGGKAGTHYHRRVDRFGAGVG